MFSAQLKKKVGIWLIGVVALLFTGAATVTLYVLTRNNNQNTFAGSAVVYKSGGECLACLDGEKCTIPHKDAASFVFDKEGERLFYTVPSQYSKGTFDLYALSREFQKETLLDYGIRAEYYLGNGGNRLYYIKDSPQSGVAEATCCDLEQKTVTAFADNPESLFVPQGGERIYFTRMHGSVRVLYGYQPGQTPRELARGVENLRLFDEKSAPELLFESENDGQSFNLNIVYPGESPLLISDGVTRVMYDGYRAGQNLYYFTVAQNGISWKQVIGDVYGGEDSQLTKPNREDFVSVFGYHLGYPTAVANYDRKLERDAVRDALSASFAVSLGGQDAYVFNQSGSALLAEGVQSKNVQAVAQSDAPRMVFQSVSVNKTDLDIADLCTASRQNGLDKAMQTAAQAVADKTENKGLQIAVLYEGAVTRYPMEGYPPNAQYAFSEDCKNLFAFAGEKGNVAAYTSDFSQNQMPLPCQGVDEGISDYRITATGLTYLKPEEGQDYGSVFAYSDGEKTRISQGSYAFLVKNGVYSFKNYSAASAQTTTADYYYCTSQREKELVRDVFVNSVKTGNSGNTALLAKGGLYLCNADRVRQLGNSDAEILYIY